MTQWHKALALLALLVAPLFVLKSAARASSTIGRCRPAQLRLRAGAYGEAAQQFTQTLTFTNTSSRRCELMGWPGLRVKNGSGRLAAVTIVRVVQGPPGARPFGRVLLRPRDAASFDVYGADWDAGADRPCRKTSALLVRPPGDRPALEVRRRLPNCSRLFVAPLISGRRDRDMWSRVWKP